MARSSGRASKQVFETVTTVPDELLPNQAIVKVVVAKGNSLYEVTLPKVSADKLIPKSTEEKNREEILQKLLTDEDALRFMVEMPNKFRNTVLVKRGGYCVVELFDDLSSTVKGEIVNIVVIEKEWTRMPYWPLEYKRDTRGWDIESDEEANKYAMPPSEDEESEEEEAIHY
ncbi:hypothetical protein NADFUDRAFT_83508 [Nadsonia fulvescens var. elongata DSM 6958]|uniref:S1-like domain-containing protein n=1 Tax=Nadsonia fulvescens var. elongata DSM 6958 TaxID=857566 RepID=A0A1E3PGV2_9ASCO|nr:hypothetical protein NADFUDRAFT_83508 [Nadsonia fulvescens var. elongata DSM 6958]